MTTTTTATTRTIATIAADIESAWTNVNPYARPYLDAMRHLGGIGDSFGQDDARSVVLYFLSNAASFRGDRARVLKAELKALLAR